MSPGRGASRLEVYESRGRDPWFAEPRRLARWWWTAGGRIGADDSYNDMLESELSGEVENGRLVRLMIKLGFINERAE